MQPSERGGLESVAIVLLLVGGFVYVVGWVAGVALLWLSRVWTTRDKLLGTLVVPGGLLPAVLVLLGVLAVGGRPLYAQVLLGIAAAVLAVAPVATAVHLGRASRR